MRYLSLALALLAQTAFADDLYQTYHNLRFGYSIAYPKTILYPQGESDNGDGQKFLSKEADASLIVYGSYNALDQTYILKSHAAEPMNILKKSSLIE